jgi:perosamine synthetase
MQTCKSQGDHLTGTGNVAALESRLCDHYGVRHALCVSSATMGLLGLALALELYDFDFVTTPYTYGASLASWLLLRNRPVFADIDPQTLGLAAQSVRRRITPRTRAILAVDIFGIPSDTLELRKLADKYGIWYITDAAQSFGSKRGGLSASGLADALVVSFTTGKPLSVGEGGAVLTNRSDIYEKLIWWTQHPQRQRRDLGLTLDNEFALNGRIHPWAAAEANTLFDSVLNGITAHQKACFEIICALNESGLTEPVRFDRVNVVPSFTCLTAAWKGSAKAGPLLTHLRQQKHSVTITEAPVRLIYRQPSFVAQYGACMATVAPCPVAEQQARKRFALLSLS